MAASGLPVARADEGSSAPAEHEPPPPPRDHEGLSPSLSFHGFGDVTLSAERSRLPSGSVRSETSFALGELDLFFVSRLAENLSFLAEVVFETDPAGDFVVDVERLSLRYKISDRLFLSLGRHHAPLGYWNETFHHGLVLQPTVDRPAALKFEDNGGALPVHDVGIELGGRWFRGPWTFDYAVHVGNGRGPKSTDVQNGADRDDNKAVTLRLTVSHDGASRILFGPMVHRGVIPRDPSTPGREQDMDEKIVGAHFAYRDDRLELLAESYHLRHEERGAGRRFVHPSRFVVATWRAWKWKPYAGYDRLKLDTADLFYEGAAAPIERFLFGVRFDLHPFASLKFEYDRDEQPGRRADAIRVQSGFTF